MLPLTTEEFPAKEELASDYLQTPYRVYQNDDPDVSETPKTRETLLREMVALRLSHGFQIVVGKTVEETAGQYTSEPLNIFDTQALSKDGTTLFMSLGNTIHKLVCDAGGEIELTKFTRKTLYSPPPDERDSATSYHPAVRTILGAEYRETSITCDVLGKNTTGIVLMPT